MRRASMSIAIGVIVATSASGGQVIRRGAEPPLEGEITAADYSEGGVTMHAASGADHFIAWDRVREVVTDQPHPAHDAFLARAEQLWRARSRVERHDTALAEPLLARLFEHTQGQTHETALVVAEGLLRCRLARGDHAGAIIPALETARLHRANVTTMSYSSLPPVMDGERSLCTVLAPAWTPSRAVMRLAHDLERYDAQDDAVIEVMALLYRRAALLSAGESLPDVNHPEDRSENSGAGVRLLAMCVEAHETDANARSDARARIMKELESAEGWVEAWLRFALGASLLMEEGVGRRQEGMVQLLHLPARFEREQPFLAGLALHQVAAAVETHGDAESAKRLRAELQRRFPEHPVLNSPLQLTRSEHD